MTLRILHVAALNFPSSQGTQVFIRQLCESQAGRGHDVHLLTYAHGLPGHRPQGFTHHRLADFPRFRSLRSGPTWEKAALDLAMAAAVDALVRRLRPGIVQGHHYEGLAASLAGAAGRCPVVYHAHTLLGPELPWYVEGEGLKAAARRLGAWADRVLPGRADAVVTVSAALRDALAGQGIPASRVHYVPPAVDADGLDPSGPGAEGADLVYAGNLDGYQGVFEVLEGMALMMGAAERARLMIVTDSDFCRQRDFAARLGIGDRVAFVPHGDFEDASARIRASRAALSPRIIPGGFPIKLLNYLRLEKPVIATRHGAGGLEEGREVLVYDSPARFAAAAESILENPDLASRLGRAAARRAADHFTWRRSLPLLDNLYESLIR